MRNKVYSVSGGNFECKVLAKDTREAADIFHRVAGSAYEIRKIELLFEVYVKD